ncbi:MAG: carboxylate-amine ligase, partial [Actinomycetota bacterium]|nr:carboxylate-amine ligase [Actinomycetota bacterium]
IELRVLDSQTSLESAVALAALTQCLVVKALSEGARGPYDRELAAENKWRASRHGMNAAFYDAEKGVTVPAKESARALVDELRPISQDLGCDNELLNILEIVENGTGSQHQRRVYQESGDFLDVVAFLIESTRPAMAEASGEEQS